MRTRHLMGLAVAALALAVLYREARACGLFLRAPNHAPEALVRSADDRLVGGALDAAAAQVRLHRDLRASTPADSDAPDALFRTLADAVARSGGAVDLGMAWPSQTEAERQAHLRWACTVLEQLRDEQRNERGGPSPRVLTALGVAQSQLEERHHEARILLEALARDELVTSADGWAALARLRSEAGDEERASVARVRCRLIRDEAALCGEAPEIRSPRDAS